MNHSDSTAASGRVEEQHTPGRENERAGIHRLLTFLGLILYGSLLGLQAQSTDNPLLMLGFGLILYVLGVYLYFGVEVTAFFSQYLWIVVGGLGAIAAILFIAGGMHWSSAVAPVGSIVGAGTTAGILTRRGWRPLRVFLIGVAILGVFYSFEFAPLWKEFMNNGSATVELLLEDVKTDLGGMGLTIMEQDTRFEIIEGMLKFIVRLAPAITFLSVAMIFALAHLLFLWRAQQINPVYGMRPFILWKVPFPATVAVIAAVVCRLLGNDLLQLVADNVLLILIVGYCLAGFALLEYTLQKLGAGLLLRVCFYLLLLVTQVLGLLAMALVGFIDSFADWRKVESGGAGPASLEKST